MSLVFVTTFFFVFLCVFLGGRYFVTWLSRPILSSKISGSLQYTRYFAYSDASFFPRTIPMWNSLPSSVVSSKTIEEFKAQI